MSEHLNRCDEGRRTSSRSNDAPHTSSATLAPRIGHIAWTVLLPVLVALLSHRAAAQGSAAPRAGTAPTAAPPPLPTTAPSAAHPFDGITLTTEQQTALKRAMAQTQAARAAILRRQAQGGQLSREDRDALIALGKAHNARVDSLLAPAQRARLASNVAAEGERRNKERRAAWAQRAAATRRR